MQIVILLLCFNFNALAERLPIKVHKTIYNAQQAIKKNNYKKALFFVKKYNQNYPSEKHFIVEFTFGNILVFLNNNKDAIFHYKKSVNLNPKFAPSWQNLGTAFYNLQKYEKAGDCMLKAFNLSKKKNYNLLYYGSVFYLTANKLKKAKKNLKILCNDKNKPKALWLEAYLSVCIKLKDFKQGKIIIEQLLELKKDDPSLWKTITWFYLQQNQYKKALTSLNLFFYLSPKTSVQDLILFGDLYNINKIPLKAAKYYEDAATNVQIKDYSKIINAYIMACKNRKAEEILTIALKKKPDSKLYFLKGWLLYEKKDFENAIDAFKKSIALEKSNYKGCLMLGYCYLIKGELTKAKQILNKALAISNNSLEVKNLLIEIENFAKNNQKS